MSKKYTLRDNRLTDAVEDQKFARKEAALRAAEKIGLTDWVVLSPSGVVVAASEGDQEVPETPAEEAPVVDVTGEVAEGAAEQSDETAEGEPTAEVADDDPTALDVPFRGHAAVYYWSTLGVDGARRLGGKPNGKDLTVRFGGPDAEEKASALADLWDAGAASLKEMKKTETYLAIPRNTRDGQKERYRVEQEHLRSFVSTYEPTAEDVL